MTLKRLIPTLLILSLALTAGAHAKEEISSSASSQIAAALERVILDEFKKDTGMGIHLQIFSSKTSINRLKNGFCELAASTVRLTKEEREEGLIEIPVCRDPLVVIIHPELTLTSLTLNEVRRIFSGNIRNWREVGGPDLPITVIIPDAKTGAHENFKKQVMGHFYFNHDLMTAKTTTAIDAVNHMPGAIAFIAQGVASKSDTTRIVQLNGKPHTDPLYPLFQTFYFVTRGKPTGPVKEVINYGLSQKARDYLSERGMYPIIH